MARPTKYNPENTPQQAEAIARDFSTPTNDDIAEGLCVDVATVKRWAVKYPLFRAAIKRGKDVPDRQVENAALSRALGKEFVSEVRRKPIVYQGTPVLDPTTGKPLYEVIKKRSCIPPDTAAFCFWLVNRRPDKWRHIQKVEANIVNPKEIIDKLNDITEALTE